MLPLKSKHYGVSVKVRYFLPDSEFLSHGETTPGVEEAGKEDFMRRFQRYVI